MTEAILIDQLFLIDLFWLGTQQQAHKPHSLKLLCYMLANDCLFSNICLEVVYFKRK